MINVTAPGTLNVNGETYVLQNDINAPAGAFVVSGNNITFDLNGYTVNYNQSGAGNGVTVSGSGNTVKNGYITQGADRDDNSPAVKLSGYGHVIEYLVIKVAGDIPDGADNNAPGIYVNSYSTEIHHCFINNQGTTADISASPRGIYIDERNNGGFNIHHNIIVGPHQGIAASYVGLYTYPGLPGRSYIYNNFIQHTRTGGTKSPYGIALGKSSNFEIYNNHIASDDGRGITFDGLGQTSSPPGSASNDCHDNIIDTEYSVQATEGGYPENNVYGGRSRYNSGNCSYNNNFVNVRNILDIGGAICAGFFMGSDAADPEQAGCEVSGNTIIINGLSIDVALLYGWAPDLIVSNNKWYGASQFSRYYDDGYINNLTETNNTQLTPVNYTPAKPSGLQLRKFNNDYSLEWSPNTGETQTYFYKIYRDGTPLNISTRAVLFFVDADVSGSHTYQVQAVNLNGNTSALSDPISTAQALEAWEETSPAGTYYVSNSGNNNNNGTFANPFATIQKAVDVAQGGDFIYVFPGTYAPPSISGRDFSASFPLTILPYSGMPLISGGTFLFSGSSFIKLAGFEFNNCEIRIYSGSENITVENNISRRALYPVYIRDSSFNIVRNNVVNNGNPGEVTGETGIRLYGAADYNLIEKNEIYGMTSTPSTADGIGLYQGPAFNIIRDNLIHHCTDDGIDGWYAGARNVISGNICYKCGYDRNDQPQGGNGKGIKTNYNSNHWLLRRNVCYDNLAEGLSDEDSGGSNTFYHNTAYKNGSTNYTNFNRPDLAFKNNISCGPDSSGLFGGNGNVHEANFAVCDPWFIDAAGRDFKLAQGSPLIDQGASLTTTTSGGSNTTIVNVGQARYFIDGYGITDGDLIRVGNNDPVRIVAINYGSNAITLSDPITYNNGDPVNLVYYGTAPDVGAYEYQGQAPDPIISALRVNIWPQAATIITAQPQTRRRFIC